MKMEILEPWKDDGRYTVHNAIVTAENKADEWFLQEKENYFVRIEKETGEISLPRSYMGTYGTTLEYIPFQETTQGDSSFVPNVNAILERKCKDFSVTLARKRDGSEIRKSSVIYPGKDGKQSVVQEKDWEMEIYQSYEAAKYVLSRVREDIRTREVYQKEPIIYLDEMKRLAEGKTEKGQAFETFFFPVDFTKRKSSTPYYPYNTITFQLGTGKLAETLANISKRTQNDALRMVSLLVHMEHEDSGLLQPIYFEDALTVYKNLFGKGIKAATAACLVSERDFRKAAIQLVKWGAEKTDARKAFSSKDNLLKDVPGAEAEFSAALECPLCKRLLEERHGRKNTR